MTTERYTTWWKPQVIWLYKAEQTSRILCMKSRVSANDVPRDSLISFVNAVEHGKVALSTEDTAHSFENSTLLSGISSSSSQDEFSSNGEESMSSLEGGAGGSGGEDVNASDDRNRVRKISLEVCILNEKETLTSLQDSADITESERIQTAVAEAKIRGLEGKKTYLQKWIKRERSSHLATKKLYQNAQGLAESKISQLESVTEECSQLRRLVANLQQQENEATARYLTKDLDLEIETLRLENVVDECSKLKQLVVDLQQERRDVKTACQNAQTEFQELRRQVQHKDEEIAWLRKLYTDRNGEALNKAKAEITAMIQQHMKTCRLNSTLRQQMCYETCQALEMKCDAIYEQLTQSQEESRRLGIFVATARDEAGFFASRCRSMTAALEGKPGTDSDIRKVLEIRDKECSDLREYALGLEKTNEKIEQELERQAHSMKNLQDELQDQTFEMTSLQYQVESYQSSNESMINKVCSYYDRDDTVIMVGQYYDIVRGHNKALSESVTKLKTKLQESTDEVAMWEEKYDNLERTHTNKTDEFSKLEEKNRALDGDVFRLDIDNDMLNRQMKEQHLAISALVESEKELSQGLVELRSLPLPDQVRCQLEINREEITRLERKLSQANAHIASQTEKENVRIHDRGFEVQREVWEDQENERLRMRLETTENELAKALQRANGTAP